jgi:YVTN family beta-propeller protein
MITLFARLLTFASFAHLCVCSLKSKRRVRFASLGLFALLLLSGISVPARAQSVTFAGLQTTVPTTGLENPTFDAVDGAGNVFIVDHGAFTVVKVSPSGIQTTVPTSGLNNPNGIALDQAGDVFVADVVNNRVVEVPYLGNGTYGSQTTVPATGLNHPFGVALDAAGDIFIADTLNRRVVELPYLGGGNYGTQITLPFSGLGGPFGVALDQAGDVFVADGGATSILELPYLGSGNYGTQASIGSGLGGRPIGGPEGVAVDANGNVFAADTNNSRVVEVPYVGNGNYGAQNTVGSGLNEPTGVAVDGKDDVYIVDNGNHRVEEVQLVAPNFGPVKVGSNSTLTLTYNISANDNNNVVIYSASVVTQGATGLDFTSVADTCESTYFSSATCSIQVQFAPGAPGLRQGAVQFGTNIGTITTLLRGVGEAPQLVFPGGPLLTVNNGYYPPGVATDAAGNVYMSGYPGAGLYGYVIVIPAGCNSSSCYKQWGSGWIGPGELAVDGVGNIYVPSFYGPANTYIVPQGCTSSSCETTVGSGIAEPDVVALDGAGDIYIGDQYNGHPLYEVRVVGSQTTVGSGVRDPQGLALDDLGDVFVTSFSQGTTLEVPSVGSQSNFAPWLGGASALATDAAGDVYIANGASSVTEVPAGCTSSACDIALPGGYGYVGGLALDSAGDLYIADVNNGPLYEVQRSRGPTLSFPSTTVGATSSALTVTIQNVGNQPLTFFSFAASTNFTVDSGTTTCSTSSPLAVGATCNVGVDFAPTTGGALTGTLTLTDNALNASSATQSVPLQGTGAIVATSIAVTSVTPPSEVYGQDAQITITAVLSWSGNGPAPTAGNISIGGNGPSGTYGTTGCGAPSGNTITCTNTYIPSGADTVGSYTETAAFSGDSNYSGSSSPQSNNFSIMQASTSTSVGSDMNPSVQGQPVTFTATIIGQYGLIAQHGGSAISGGSRGAVLTKPALTKPGLAQTSRWQNVQTHPLSPVGIGGSVTWSANTGCGTTSVSGGTTQCTTSILPPGTDTITATYSGDGNHSGSMGTLNPPQQVNPTITPTTIAVTGVSPASESYGQDAAVTITAVLSWTGNGPAPTASDVTIGGNGPSGYSATTCGAPSGDTMTCSATYTPTGADTVGSYTESASFSGDSNYTGSGSSQSNNFSITAQTPSINVTSVNPASEVYGQDAASTITAVLSWFGSGTAPTASDVSITTNAPGGALGATSCGTPVVANSVIATVPVGSRPTAIAYDPSNGNVYVANIATNSVSVIQGSTNSVLATVRVGAAPRAITFDPSNGDLYVANRNDNTVSVIEGGSNTVVATVPVGNGPWVIAFDPNNGDLYVANLTDGTVSVIDGSTNTVVATVAVGSNPTGIVFDPNNGDLYVANDNSPGTVSVIDGSTNTVVATIPVVNVPYSIAFDPGNGDVYVAGNTGPNYDQVSVINGSTNTVVATLTVNDLSAAIAFDANNGNVYVINFGDHKNGTVSVISGSSNTLTTTIAVGNGANAIAIDPNNGDLYVTNSSDGTVSVIDGSSNTVIATVPVGSVPGAIAFDPTNGNIYVGNNTGGSVSVLSPSATATCTAAFTPDANTVAGTYTMSASFSGDPNYTGSSSSQSNNFSITQATSSTSVMSSLNPSLVGQQVTFTATIDGQYGLILQRKGAALNGRVNKGGVTGKTQSHPLVPAGGFGGTVTWSANTGCSPTAVSGDPGTAQCITSTLPQGTDTITATYSGDTNHSGSSATLTPAQQVNPAVTSTSIGVTSVSPASEAYGQDSQVTITAVLSWTGSGPAPTAANVSIGGNGPSGYSATTCGAPSSDTMTCSATYTPTGADTVGSYTESASFSGDSNYTGSSSSQTNNFAITQATSSTSIGSSQNPSIQGQQVTFTATVDGQYGLIMQHNSQSPSRRTKKGIAGNGHPLTPAGGFGGTVTWSSNTGCSPTAVSGDPGTAQCITSTLPQGTDTITATYSGDTNHSGSLGTLSGGQVVGEPPSITSPNTTTLQFGAFNTFTVTTTGFPTPSLSEEGALPTGVTFVDNHNGTGTLSGTPTIGGIYPISFTATNGVAPNALQYFTLYVSALEITPANVNFGTVYLNTRHKMDVKVTNVGGNVVTISGASITPGTADGAAYTLLAFCKGALKPQQSCTMGIEFLADATGTLTATLNIPNNALGSPEKAQLTASVIDPGAELNPTKLNFGTQAINSRTTLPVQLTNNGQTDLLINNIAIAGAHGSSYEQTNNCPSSLSPTNSCTINVTFAPTTKGPQRASLVIANNTSSGKNTVALTGSAH